MHGFEVDLHAQIRSYIAIPSTQSMYLEQGGYRMVPWNAILDESQESKACGTSGDSMEDAAADAATGATTPATDSATDSATDAPADAAISRQP